MKTKLNYILALIAAIFIKTAVFSQTCVGGKWDITSNVWYTDCTPTNVYDGRYIDGGNPYSIKVDGDTTITLADGRVKKIYWRLYWFNNIADNSAPVTDNIPLIVGLHCWGSDGLENCLESCLNYLENDPAAMRTISLSFSINANGSNDGTWWWGDKVNGVPTPWAEDLIIKIIKQRSADACQLLAKKGASELAGKHVDENRVYLRGASMGGTGTYRMGIKYPDVFSAIFCMAGFADFNGPCGNFCTDMFDKNMVGTAAENLQCKGIDGNMYNARNYTDMSWFIGTHKGASWEKKMNNGKKYEPPYIYMRHGTADDAVIINSADRLKTILESGKWGYTYQRDNGGHSNNAGSRPHWMFLIRKNQSYLGFSNNTTNDAFFNYLDRIGWQPSSIVDDVNHYEVKLTGAAGKTDVTLHRLQKFTVSPYKAFHYWLNTKTGTGTAVVANADGFLTISAVPAGSKIIIDADLNTTTYTLTVTGGSGSGNYAAASQVSITAGTAPTGKVFDQWTGSITGLANKFSATTTLTMPSANTAITATYKTATVTTYTLTVSSGTGSGSYAAGANVTVTANAAPTGKIFDQWTGSITGLANKFSASTTLTMPSANTSITATYKTAPVNTFSLTVTGGTGSGSYAAGTSVTIKAGTAPAGKIFDQWTGATTALADKMSATTTLTMPSANSAVTATYKSAPVIKYSLTIVNGTGSGSYAAGTKVNIIATIPSGKSFDKWNGSTNGIGSISAYSTTYTMPAANATLSASFKNVATAVDEDKEVITIYPNPAADILNINAEKIVRISIYDMNGRMMIDENNVMSSIDISHLESGVYTVIIYSEKEIYHKSLIKQ